MKQLNDMLNIALRYVNDEKEATEQDEQVRRFTERLPYIHLMRTQLSTISEFQNDKVKEFVKKYADQLPGEDDSKVEQAAVLTFLGNFIKHSILLFQSMHLSDLPHTIENIDTWMQETNILNWMRNTLNAADEMDANPAVERVLLYTFVLGMICDMTLPKVKTEFGEDGWPTNIVVTDSEESPLD